MKLKISMIAAMMMLSASVVTASLYTFNDTGYTADDVFNWSTAQITDDGSRTGSGSYGGSYPGYSPWFGTIASEESASTVFGKSSGAGYVGNGGTYSAAAGGWFVTSSATGQDSVVIVLETNKDDASNFVLTDAGGATVNGTSYGLSATFAGQGQYGPTYDYVRAWQFDTSSSDLSTYTVGFDVTSNTQIQNIQLEDAGTFAAIPEPASAGLITLAAGGLVALRRIFGTA